MNHEKISHTRFFHIVPEGNLIELESMDEALSALNRSGYVWFDFLCPGREDLSPLIQPLTLHPLAIEDCLDDDQVPKVDDFSTNTFVLFNIFDYIDKTFIIREINFFLGKNFLVSVNHCQGQQKFTTQLDEPIVRNKEAVRQGPDFLLQVILDYIVDRKFEAIEAMQEELDAAEEIILKSPTSFKPEALLHLRKNLLTLRKSLFHEREIMVRICRRDSPFVTEKAIYHFRDIYDHLAKFFEAIEIHREMITSLMEMYLTMINNRMSQVANRTNQIVRRLTLINTIFMPLTLLAGIGGMSEWSMMTGPSHWRVAYPVFLVLMVLIGVFINFVLKRLEAKDRREADSELEKED